MAVFNLAQQKLCQEFAVLCMTIYNIIRTGVLYLVCIVYIIKEVILCFWGFCLYSIVKWNIFVHVKGLQRKKSEVHGKGSYSLLQKTLLLYCLKHLVWSRGLTFVTYACASPCNRCYINMYLLLNIYTPVCQQTYSCYCYSIVILDHTTLLGMNSCTLPDWLRPAC